MALKDTKTFDKGPNSELMKFKGKIEWAQIYDLNKFGKWSIEFYPDDESLERLRELQLKNTFKKSEEGYHLQISRPPVIEFTKGVETMVTPVKTRMKDGSEVPGRIGDGSDCEIACEVYQYKVPNSERRAKAMRLYGVEVENLTVNLRDVKKAEAEAQ